ncbi:hypothetical protein ACFFWC_12455 [Plantactinospora siamensis]|uniref:Uncharacterized protein n=1 Tax=Plantactinospora siamensis TaxID=555372 RepID=A0ABV6P1R9_9ACTN
MVAAVAANTGCDPAPAPEPSPTVATGTAAAGLPPRSALPAGLVALTRAGTGEEAQLRVYDATTGTLRRAVMVPTDGKVVFSASFQYAAEIDRSGNVLLYTLKGDRYESSGSLDPQSWGARDTRPKRVGFLPRTNRLAVELEDPDREGLRAVSLDPADPRLTSRPDVGLAPQWDSGGRPVEDVAYVEMPGQPKVGSVVVRRSQQELVEADVIGRDDDQDGGSDLLYTCHGPQVRSWTVPCFGGGPHAELATLTADPATKIATIRIIAKLGGRPFTNLYVAPDGKRLLAERADGFYATTAAGGTPKRAFGPLPKRGTMRILEWQEGS